MREIFKSFKRVYKKYGREYKSASINILKEYRHKGYGEKLLRKALNYFNNNIIAITVSKEGYKLAKKYMEEIKKLNKDVSVFERKSVNGI